MVFPVVINGSEHDFFFDIEWQFSKCFLLLLLIDLFCLLDNHFRQVSPTQAIFFLWGSHPSKRELLIDGVLEPIQVPILRVGLLVDIEVHNTFGLLFNHFY